MPVRVLGVRLVRGVEHLANDVRVRRVVLRHLEARDLDEGRRSGRRSRERAPARGIQGGGG
jgi:hypothetical protein